MFDPFDNPPPTSEQQIAERKYRKVVGIVRHNAPAGIDEIRRVYARTYDDYRQLEARVQLAIRNGHVRPVDGGFEATEAVR